MATTSDALVDGIKKRVTMPASQALITDADIRSIADTMIKGRMVPLVTSLNQEFFVTITDTDIEAGVSLYAIPYRAIGRKLRELKLVVEDENVRNIAQIALEDAQSFYQATFTCGFYYQGDKVRLVPDVQSDITIDQALRMWWYCPPSALCGVSQAALVVSISDTVVTCVTVPSEVAGAAAIDFVQGRSGNSILGFDVVPTSTSATTVTFSSADDIPTDLQAGDYISVAGTSPVVNFLPNESQPLLESYCAERVCQRIGDFDGMKTIKEDISAEEKSLKLLLEPRIDGEPVIIINRQGLVRGMKFTQRPWVLVSGD